MSPNIQLYHYFLPVTLTHSWTSVATSPVGHSQQNQDLVSIPENAQNKTKRPYEFLALRWGFQLSGFASIHSKAILTRGGLGIQQRRRKRILAVTTNKE